MSRPQLNANSRFVIEVFNHAGAYVMNLPYMNVQMDLLMRDKGSALRFNTPFRDNDRLTIANLYPGIHEVWLYDRQDNIYFFGGPIWDITASSDSGLLSISAQDKSSYLVKRVLKASKSYIAQQPADIMIDLLNYTTGIKSIGIAAPSKMASNAQTVTVRFAAADRNKISDLFSQVQNMGDGVDWYFRGGSVYFYGGLINPTAQTRAIEFGGDISNYSLQFNAQTISNDLDVVGSNGLVGNAVDSATQTSYNMLYQDVANTTSNLTSSTALNTSAATQIKAVKNTKVTPTIVSKTLLPIRDFDFGTQFGVTINDGYAQYSGTIRVMGAQLTLAQSDDFTTVLYTNDLLELTG